MLSLLILPHFLKIYGAWLAVPIAEAVTLLVTVPFHKVYFIGRGGEELSAGVDALFFICTSENIVGRYLIEVT